MGRIIQIRVTASTYNEDDVKRAWPKVFEHAFKSSSPGSAKNGALELIATLEDKLKFADLEPEIKNVLKAELPGIVKLKTDLESALGDWKADQANAISDKIEDALDDLEKIAPKE